MGKNSKQRRDARRRREARSQPGGRPGGATSGTTSTGSTHAFGPGLGPDPGAAIDLAISSTLRRLGTRRLEDDLTEQAELLVLRAAPLPASAVRRRLLDVLDQVVGDVVRNGWCPDDLVELVRRQGVEGDLPLLVHHLVGDARRQPVGPVWREQLDRVAQLVGD